jgi:serine/threonine-protein kinase
VSRERDKTIRDPVKTRLGIGHKREEARAAELLDKVVLERYLIEEPIGRGAMGTVYRGSDIQTLRAVAIKVLHPHLGDEPTMLARFQREARVAARLSHENVVTVLDVGQHECMQVMVLEFAPGPTLRDLMDDIALPWSRAVRLVGAILRGLEHAHGAGLIHRDLKPENVLVEPHPDGSEQPRIVDFGIAALADPDDSLGGGRLTGTGVVIGTPMYMAPEQAMGESIDQRIDLFALGVTTYEMLAGKPPFAGSVNEIVLANVHKDPPSIGGRVDPLHEAFARKLMARDRTRRFASATDALAMLARIETDPDTARLDLGLMDVTKAISVIWLPEPK